MIGSLITEVNFHRWLDTIVASGKDAQIVESAAIDCQSYDRALVTLDIGAAATNAGVVAFYVEECDTSGGTYAAIPGASITHTNGVSGEAKKTHVIDTKLNKRYIKVVYKRTVQDTALDSGLCLLYNGKKLPVAQNAAVKEQVVC